MKDDTQDERKKKRRKPPLLLILILLIAAAAILLYLGRGMGFGQGGGGEAGSPSAPVSDSPAPLDSQEPQESDTPAGVELTIEVTKGQYLIDGEEVSLEDIEEKVSQADPASSKITIKDNYGSAQAHDELTALLAKYGISTVTE